MPCLAVAGPVNIAVSDPNFANGAVVEGAKIKTLFHALGVAGPVAVSQPGRPMGYAKRRTDLS